MVSTTWGAGSIPTTVRREKIEQGSPERPSKRPGSIPATVKTRPSERAASKNKQPLARDTTPSVADRLRGLKAQYKSYHDQYFEERGRITVLRAEIDAEKNKGFWERDRNKEDINRGLIAEAADRMNEALDMKPKLEAEINVILEDAVKKDPGFKAVNRKLGTVAAALGAATQYEEKLSGAIEAGERRLNGTRESEDNLYDWIHAARAAGNDCRDAMKPVIADERLKSPTLPQEFLTFSIAAARSNSKTSIEEVAQELQTEKARAAGYVKELSERQSELLATRTKILAGAQAKILAQSQTKAHGWVR